MAITHNAVVVVPDDGTSPVGSDEWNAAHTIEAGTVTDTHVAAANKDGAAATASMRTLGTGAAAACAGNDARLSDARQLAAGTDKTKLDAIGVFLTASSTADYVNPSAGTPVAYTSAGLTLTPGTWLVSAGAFQYLPVGAGGACLAVYNGSDETEVANSRGPGASGSATFGSIITSRPAVVTVTADKYVCPYIIPEASSRAAGSSVAGGPTAYIVAQRLA